MPIDSDENFFSSVPQTKNAVSTYSQPKMHVWAIKKAKKKNSGSVFSGGTHPHNKQTKLHPILASGKTFLRP